MAQSNELLDGSSNGLTQVETAVINENGPDKAGALCNLCTQFVGQSISQLFNIILNAGVVGTCSAVCGQLKNSVEKTVCTIGCDAVGIKVFISLINKMSKDINPVYFCEVVK